MIRDGLIHNQQVIDDLYTDPLVPPYLLPYYTASLLLLFNAPSNGWSQVQPTLADVKMQADLEGLDTSKLLRFVRSLFPMYINWQNERMEAQSTEPKQLPKIGRA